MTPPILGLIFKSCLTRNLPTQDTSLSLQTHLYSVGQPISMTEKRGVSAVSKFWEDWHRDWGWAGDIY